MLDRGGPGRELDTTAAGSDAASTPPQSAHPSAHSSALVPRSAPPARVQDVVVGSADIVVRIAARGARAAVSLAAPAYRVAVRPLPRTARPAELLRRAAARGERRRRATEELVARNLDELVPLMLDIVLRRVALTEVILENVDLDAVVGAVDLDAPAARLDLDAVTNRLDLDALAARLDVEKVLDQLDLTAVVLERVDLDALVTAVLDRIDLVTLAQEVIDAVDLPALVRDSTGTMASDSVRGARIHAIAADEMVTRAVERLRHRRRPDGAAGPGVSTPGPQS